MNNSTVASQQFCNTHMEKYCTPLLGRCYCPVGPLQANPAMFFPIMFLSKFHALPLLAEKCSACAPVKLSIIFTTRCPHHPIIYYIELRWWYEVQWVQTLQWPAVDLQCVLSSLQLKSAADVIHACVSHLAASCTAPGPCWDVMSNREGLKTKDLAP